MDFTTVFSSHHILVPQAYCRLYRYVKPFAPVHSARKQAEIHDIALGFQSETLYIPKVFSVGDTGYETECIYHEKGHIFQLSQLIRVPKLFVEVSRFKEYMLKEGYFVYGLKLCQIAETRWAVFDFSRYGQVSNKKVIFPKDTFQYRLESAEFFYGFHVL